MSKDRQEKLWEEIRNTPKLPDSYYETLYKYYPDYFNQGAWGAIYNRLVGERRNQCQCMEIYFPFGYIEKSIPFAQQIVALELEEHFSQKKCYEFNMSITEFGGNTRSITEAAQFYYKKNLNELTEREIVELNVIHIAPTYYSPIRNRKRLDEAVNNIMDKANN
jgi:hypothetical protein